MTIEEIKELIQVVNSTGIAELEVTRGDNRVRIRRSLAAAPTQEIVLPAASVVPAAAAAVGASAPAALAPPAAAHAPSAPAGVPDENTVYVKSPIVGTYYESASPGSPAFVNIGDRVSPGQVLCIIESMKLMNEIESDVSGVVVARLVENGRPVEYGESLFAIRPA
jgi:acetyl-CoA carboxylase biotin carboxyl carrier protein